MSRFEITDKNDVHDIINMIQKSESDDVVINFKKGSRVYQNSSNLKIIRKIADDLGKNVRFEVENEKHKDFIEAVNNDTLNVDDSQVDLDAHESTSTSYSKVSARRGIGIAGVLSLVPFIGGKKKKVYKAIGIVFTSIVLLLVLFVGLFWYIPTATVEIKLNSEVLVKLLNVTADSNRTENSVEEKSIPALSLVVTEEDSQTNPTTGTKEIGEKATGEITIFNKTDDKIEIDKGTIIKLISTNEESLRYVILEDIEIGEKKEETTTTPAVDPPKTVYGKKTVKIEAAVFGDAYNQDSDQKFEIDDYDTDELIGGNEDDIEGGLQEEINVVTQSDLDTLQKELNEFMQKKAFSSLEKKTVSGQVLLDSSVKYVVLSTEFSQPVDQEAGEVTLRMSMKATGLAYSEGDLELLVTELVKEIIPAEYQLDEEKPEYEVAVLGVSDDGTSLELQVKLRSYITPNLDEDKIRNDLTAMQFDQAEEYMANLPNVVEYNITMSPRMPEFLKSLPRRFENIVIVINK